MKNQDNKIKKILITVVSILCCGLFLFFVFKKKPASTPSVDSSYMQEQEQKLKKVYIYHCIGGGQLSDDESKIITNVLKSQNINYEVKNFSDIELCLTQANNYANNNKDTLVLVTGGLENTTNRNLTYSNLDYRIIDSKQTGYFNVWHSENNKLINADHNTEYTLGVESGSAFQTFMLKNSKLNENDKYVDDLDRTFHIKYYDSVDGMLNALENQEIDTMLVDVSQYLSLKDQNSFQFPFYISYNTHYQKTDPVIYINNQSCGNCDKLLDKITKSLNTYFKSIDYSIINLINSDEEDNDDFEIEETEEIEEEYYDESEEELDDEEEEEEEAEEEEEEEDEEEEEEDEEEEEEEDEDEEDEDEEDEEDEDEDE